MRTPEALLDTNIISLLIRRDPATVENARQYRSTYKQFTISIITRYEILRGFKASGASTKLAYFERFCRENNVLPLSDEIIDQASNIYAVLYRQGALISDADILIAATAWTYGRVMITDNEKHFNRVTDLQIENWSK